MLRVDTEENCPVFSQTSICQVHFFTFVAVWEEEDDATLPPPLSLSCCDERIDNHLRAVGEITKLRFPAYERIWVLQAVALFESKHRHLGQVRIGNLESLLFDPEVVQWIVHCTVILSSRTQQRQPKQKKSGRNTDTENFRGQPIGIFSNAKKINSQRQKFSAAAEARYDGSGGSGGSKM